MANPDLRDWLAQMEAAGELQKVSGADRNEEIGGIVDIYQRQTNRPALLFDDIPGYPRGPRVAALRAAAPNASARRVRGTNRRARACPIGRKAG